MDYIYALVCPIEKVIRYIGKAENPQARFVNHITTAKTGTLNHHNARWIRKLLRAGLRPELKILAEVKYGECWQDVERRFISEAVNNRARLTNIMVGGEGPHFLTKSDELIWRKKLTTARIRCWKDPEYRSATIKKSKAGLATEAVKKKMSGIRKVLRNEPIARAKQSMITVHMWSDSQMREKMSAGIKAAWADPDIRAKQCAAMRASLSSPEARAKKSAAMKAAWERRKREAAQQQTEAP